MTATVKIGILYSTTGPYRRMGQDARDGATMAIEEIAADPGAGVRVEAVTADPGGDPARYLEAARTMLRDEGVRLLVGTITSLARKEVIPLVEKHDGLLWYMCPYEGFEANESVIYTGACPNQHLVPLFDHLLPRHGNRAYLTGANYVWGWEMNRLARDLLGAAGGEVLGERYLPLEETDVARLVGEIAERRPDFVLNNLIGPASYAFLKAMAELGARDPRFRPEACPVVSCDLTECELPEIAAGAAVGQLSTASYFDSLPGAANAAFKARAAARFGAGRRLSSFFEGAYTAVRLLGGAVAEAGTDAPEAVKAALVDRSFATPHGPMTIDGRTQHAALPFLIGRIGADGGFEVLDERPALVADPYLTQPRAAAPRPSLKVVS